MGRTTQKIVSETRLWNTRQRRLCQHCPFAEFHRDFNMQWFYPPRRVGFLLHGCSLQPLLEIRDYLSRNTERQVTRRAFIKAAIILLA